MFSAVSCISVAATVFLSGCTKPAKSQAGGMPPAAPVDVAAAAERTLAETEDFTGRIEAADVVELRARIRGPIDSVHVADGATVARGALLFTIDPRSYEAELARAEGQRSAAHVQARLADKELQRARVLLPQQAVSAQEVEQLAASVEAAQAALQQADAALRTARLNLEYTAVRAPVAGRVSRIAVTRGNLVDDQRVLSMLIGAQKAHVSFEVSEGTFLRLRKTPEVRRQVRMGLADEDGLPRSGRVDFIDNRLDAQTGTLRLRASFDNADGALVPGLFARVRVESAAPRPVVLAPERAIATDQDRKFVWVLGANNVPEPRPVALGAQVGAMRVLASGVKPGERIVVGGLQRVRPGMPVAPQELQLDAQGMPVPATPPAPAAPASGAAR